MLANLSVGGWLTYVIQYRPRVDLQLENGDSLGLFVLIDWLNTADHGWDARLTSGAVTIHHTCYWGHVLW